MFNFREQKDKKESKWKSNECNKKVQHNYNENAKIINTSLTNQMIFFYKELITNNMCCGQFECIIKITDYSITSGESYICNIQIMCLHEVIYFLTITLLKFFFFFKWIYAYISK